MSTMPCRFCPIRLTSGTICQARPSNCPTTSTDLSRLLTKELTAHTLVGDMAETRARFKLLCRTMGTRVQECPDGPSRFQRPIHSHPILRKWHLVPGRSFWKNGGVEFSIWTQTTPASSRISHSQ